MFYIFFIDDKNKYKIDNIIDDIKKCDEIIEYTNNKPVLKLILNYLKNVNFSRYSF
jgi:hypothetical protein